MIPIIPVNVDRNLPAKFFADATDLFVSSWFRTIQGEGPYAGFPSVFLRLAGCNFGAKSPEGACSWCDTAFQIDNASRMSVDNVVDKLLTVHGRKPTDVLVITGGEPTLQLRLLDLLDRLSDVFPAMQLETNGTQSPFFEQLVGHKCNLQLRVVVSPKANYTVARYPALKHQVQERADDLKFVIDADPESPHHRVPDWAFDLKTRRGIDIYVSPMARYLRAPTSEISSIWDRSLVDADVTAQNYNYAAEYAMRHGLRLSLQTHLFFALP